ncbi:sugar transferase [Propionibacterium sp.]|uniref:sugar transferase n=1 Tax=Propionibacterium sp. TaxID=1977903 RepID=UPI0039E95383
MAFPWSEPDADAETRASWKRKVGAILFCADLIVIAVVVRGTVGFWVSESARIGGPVGLSYRAVAVVAILVWVFVLGATGSRSTRNLGAGLEEYRKVVEASLWVFGFGAIVSYVLQASISRGLFVTTLPVGVAVLLLERWVVRQAINAGRSKGRALTRTLVVGFAPAVGDLLNTLESRPEVGYRASGVCVLGAEQLGTSLSPQVTRHRPYQLISAATEGGYGAVIVADGLRRSEVRDLAWQLESRPTELMFLPRLMDVAGPRMTISDVEGLSLVHVDLPRFSGWRLWFKRGFDIVFSAVVLVLLLPVFLIVAVLIKMDDGGPVFLRQERIGRRGTMIRVHKFRTMCVDAESKIDALIAANGGTALLFKMADDPRITPIGKILRKYSIDELPQFWSVLCGGMSVVGPRPGLPREVPEYSKAYYRRLLIKPGITGLWQVSGRSDLSLEESIRLDLRYVENWSLVGDLMIMLKTVRVVLQSGGAY